MLTLQRPIEASAIAGPSRLPMDSPKPTKIRAPIPIKARAKARSPSFSPSASSSGTPPPRPTARSRAATTPSRAPSRTERRYQCIHVGCDKAYFKPSRLKEHELTHTGERPHPCPHCYQTYLRASHLTAHMRTHLPSSARPFLCDHKGCDKAFWTATHLKRHQAMHEDADVYPCPHCSASFHKANQLRDHHAAAHMPAGTKSFICPHEDCSASFSMRQQLKAHEKTHDATRYTCSHPAHDTHPSFPTWSALQSHLHSAHPPQCPHPECSGRTFKSAQKLKDHLKVHALRADDTVKRNTDGEEEDGEEIAKREKKRRRSSVGDGIGEKRKRIVKSAVDEEHSGGHSDLIFPIDIPEPSSANRVDIISGPSSSRPGSEARRYGCPIKHIHTDLQLDEGKEIVCHARFWRVYDVRRHLKAGHGVDLEDEEARELLVQAEEGKRAV